MKKNNNKEGRIILSSYMMNSEMYKYEYYLEYCKINGFEANEDNSDDYWKWVSFEEECNYNDFFENLKYCDAEKHKYAMTYTLREWDGKYDGIYVREFNGLSDAIKTAFGSSRYYEGYKVSFTDGEFIVSCLHHDGTNVFRIRCISKHGERAFDGLTKYDEEKWQERLNKKDNFKKIKSFSY